MALIFRQYEARETDQIVDLFASVFADSEGAEEGEIIRILSYNLIAKTEQQSLFVFCAYEDSLLVGAVIFSRMWYDAEKRVIYLLSPLAIKTSYQGKGIGQRLVRYGLTVLREHGVDAVITYGSPDYYGKTGFQQITSKTAKPPYELQHPHGWLAQSLGQGMLDPIKGSAKCVAAFENPNYW